MGGGQSFEAFAAQYLAAKLHEVDAALARLDLQPDALDHHATRERLVELRAQLVAALAAEDDPTPQ